jgi:hypothetical protein
MVRRVIGEQSEDATVYRSALVAGGVVSAGRLPFPEVVRLVCWCGDLALPGVLLVGYAVAKLRALP